MNRSCAQGEAVLVLDATTLSTAEVELGHGKSWDLELEKSGISMDFPDFTIISIMWIYWEPVKITVKITDGALRIWGCQLFWKHFPW